MKLIIRLRQLLRAVTKGLRSMRTAKPKQLELPLRHK